MQKYYFLNQILQELEKYDLSEKERLQILKEVDEDKLWQQQVSDIPKWTQELLTSNNLQPRKRLTKRYVDQMTRLFIGLFLALIIINYVLQYSYALLLIAAIFLTLAINQMIKKNYFNTISLFFIGLGIMGEVLSEQINNVLLYYGVLITAYIVILIGLKQIKSKHYRQNSDQVHLSISDFAAEDNYFANRLGGVTVSLTDKSGDTFYIDNSLGQMNVDFDDFKISGDVKIHIINNIGEIDIKLNDHYQVINKMHGTFSDINYVDDESMSKIILYGTNNLGKIHLYK